MTLPFERTNALIRARRFLLDLLDPRKTPRVPREIRRGAADVLKHYPAEYDIAVIAKRCRQDLLGKVEDK